MEAQQAFELATANSPPAFDRFYGPVGDAGIGAGILLNNVEFPTYIAQQDGFGVLRGLVLVLTHECDLDQANDRIMNDAAIVCPVIPLESFAESLEAVLDDQAAGVLLGNVTARYVNRLVYLPLIPDVLPLGGYLYLNMLTNTHYSKLASDDVQSVCMMSGDGLRELDYALERHLRRPKADRVPFEVIGLDS
jgi:hypothetical protein